MVEVRDKGRTPTMCVGLGPLPPLFCVQNEPACGDGVRVAVLVDSSLGDLGHPDMLGAQQHCCSSRVGCRPLVPAPKVLSPRSYGCCDLAPRGRLVVALVRLMRSAAVL